MLYGLANINQSFLVNGQKSAQLFRRICDKYIRCHSGILHLRFRMTDILTMPLPKPTFVNLGNGYRLVDGDGGGVYWRIRGDDYGEDYPVGPDNRYLKNDHPYLVKRMKELYLSSFSRRGVESLNRYIELMGKKDDIFAGCKSPVCRSNVPESEKKDDPDYKVVDCKTPSVCYAQFTDFANAALKVGVSLGDDSPFILEMINYLGENGYMVYLNYFAEPAARSAYFGALEDYVEMAKAEATKSEIEIPKWKIDSLSVKAHRQAARNAERSARFFKRLHDDYEKKRRQGHRYGGGRVYVDNMPIIEQRGETGAPDEILEAGKALGKDWSSKLWLEKLDKYLDLAKGHLEWIGREGRKMTMVNTDFVEGDLKRIEEFRKEARRTGNEEPLW